AITAQPNRVAFASDDEKRACEAVASRRTTLTQGRIASRARDCSQTRWHVGSPAEGALVCVAAATPALHAELLELLSCGNVEVAFAPMTPNARRSRISSVSQPPQVEPISDDMLGYYRRGGEEARLIQDGQGLLEQARTQELLERFLPVPPELVLDVG